MDEDVPHSDSRVRIFQAGVYLKVGRKNDEREDYRTRPRPRPRTRFLKITADSGLSSEHYLLCGVKNRVRVRTSSSSIVNYGLTAPSPFHHSYFIIHSLDFASASLLFPL